MAYPNPLILSGLAVTLVSSERLNTNPIRYRVKHHIEGIVGGNEIKLDTDTIQNNADDYQAGTTLEVRLTSS